MGWADDFATGFAAGFVPAYQASSQRREARRTKEFDAMVSQVDKLQEARNEARQEVARRRKAAKNLTESLGVADTGAMFRALELYDDDTEKVIEGVNNGTISFDEQDTAPAESTQMPEGLTQDSIIEASQGPTREAGEALNAAQAAGVPESAPEQTTDTSTDAQMRDSGLVNQENITPEEDRNAVGTLLGAYDTADSRMQGYLQRTGQDASTLSADTSDLEPESGYSLNVRGGSEDLSNLLGKDTRFIDDWMAVNGNSLNEEQISIVNGLRERSTMSDSMSDAEIARMSDPALESMIALSDGDEQNRYLTALESRGTDDEPTSPKNAAFTSFWEDLDNSGMSEEERLEALADFEKTWKDMTASGSGFDIYDELRKASSVNKATALRVSVANNTQFSGEEREQYLSLIDQSLGALNEVKSGNYTLEDFKSDTVQYTMNMNSEDPKVREEAMEWFNTTRPQLLSALQVGERAALDIQVETLMGRGNYTRQQAEAIALDQVDSGTDSTGDFRSRNAVTGEVLGESSNYGGASEADYTVRVQPPEDFDISTASEESRELAARSDEELANEAEIVEQEMLELAGADDVPDFEARLRNIDVPSALGIRGMFTNTVNTVQGAFGADGQFPESRRAAAALERLQRYAALVGAQAQPNVRGGTYLLEMLRANAVQPNDMTGPSGAREKFESNFALLRDQVSDLEATASPDSGVTPQQRSKARSLVRPMTRIRDYYGALVENMRSSGEDVSGSDFLGRDTPSESPEGQQSSAPEESAQLGQDDAIEQAREAISNGAPTEDVRQRLIDNGYDPSGL